jgi:phosphoglycolate phosphatase-like HAD superfamily hydrolase
MREINELSWKSIKGLTWDMDGTLFDSRSIHIQSMQVVIKYFEEKSVRVTEILLHNKANLVESLKYFLPNNNYRLHDVVKLYEEIYINLLNDQNLKLYDEVLNSLVELKKNSIKQAIFTSNTRKITEYIIETYNLDVFFDVVVTCDDCKPKPSTEGLEYIIKSFNADINSHGFIGDSWVDMEIAKSIGVIPFYATWGKQRVDKNDPNLIVLKSPNDILIGGI